ncbi:hypothetical protein EVA_06460 [gut metagenome]|uniref:Uncharacterized protein n=1 Tax=gut metagenome TaxID=749906 RepID=J9GS57_9ZZZZ
MTISTVFFAGSPATLAIILAQWVATDCAALAKEELMLLDKSLILLLDELSMDANALVASFSILFDLPETVDLIVSQIDEAVWLMLSHVLLAVCFMLSQVELNELEILLHVPSAVPFMLCHVLLRKSLMPPNMPDAKPLSPFQHSDANPEMPCHVLVHVSLTVLVKPDQSPVNKAIKASTTPVIKSMTLLKNCPMLSHVVCHASSTSVKSHSMPNQLKNSSMTFVMVSITVEITSPMASHMPLRFHLCQSKTLPNLRKISLLKYPKFQRIHLKTIGTLLGLAPLHPQRPGLEIHIALAKRSKSLR